MPVIRENGEAQEEKKQRFKDKKRPDIIAEKIINRSEQKRKAYWVSLRAHVGERLVVNITGLQLWNTLDDVTGLMDILRIVVAPVVAGAHSKKKKRNACQRYGQGFQ